MKIPASYHQERLWFIDKFETGYLYESAPIYHNIPLILQVKGPLDYKILEKSFRGVIQRHEALRTLIITEDDRPFQQVNQEVDFHLSVLDLTTEENSSNNVSCDHATALAMAEARRPFLLQEAEILIRGKLIRFEQQGFILAITLHHIIADRHSLGIFLKELWGNYREYLKGNTPQWLELSIHYADFSRWQRQMPVKLSESLSGYWKLKLSGKLQPLELPTDRPRALVHTFHSEQRFFTIPGPLTRQIKNYSQKEEISHFTLVLAAFKVLLSKYSGLGEIVVGTVGPNRNQPGLVGIIGPVANLLVLRSELSGGDTFLSFLHNLDKTLNEAYKYQAMPFDKLVLELHPDIDMSRTALFDVLFQYEDAPMPLPPVENLEITYVETNLGWGKYDLNMLIYNEGENFSGILVYNSDYYNHSTISRLLEHYLELLGGLLAYRDRPIATFSLLTETEQQRLLSQWNQGQVNYPRDKTIHQLFAEQAARTPDNIALVGTSLTAVKSPGENTRSTSVTYWELNEKAEQWANVLREKAVGPDSIVGIMMERSLELIMGILAILKAGGAYLPIDPDYPQERREYMLKDSGARIMIGRAEERKSGRAEFVFSCFFPASSLPRFLASDSSDSSNLAYIIYTSGTTGKPKGSLIEHRNLVRLMVNDNHPFAFNNRDTWTMFHRCCFDFSVWEMYGALLYGGKLIVISKEMTADPEKYLKLLKTQGVTVLNQTPTAFYYLADIELQQPGKELNIRYVIFGGEALSPVHLNGWRQKYPGTRLINMYGITETTVHVTFKEITAQEIRLNISNIGAPIPTLNTYVWDSHFNFLPIGIPGELCVGGEGVGRGYLNRVELTSEKFVDNPYRPGEKFFRSGDLVRLLENGDLEYLGRIDDQVKIRGFRIELGEIENQLQTHEKIKDAVVIVREKQKEKYLCAYFVSNHHVTASELREYLGRQLPDYMIPMHFVPLAAFPLTANGKIDRKALPEPEIEADADYTAPRDDIEKKLVQVWSEVLAINDKIPGTVGVNADFFALGGYSLKAITVVAHIHKIFNVKIAVADLFRYPTVREMAQYIKNLAVDLYIPLEPVEEKEYYELSSAQKRLYILQQIDPGNTTYNLPLTVVLGSDFTIERIGSIFGRLIERHEALRTSFEMLGGEMIRRIHPEAALDITVGVDDGASIIETGDPRGESAYLNLRETLKAFIKPFDLTRAPLMRVKLTRWEKKAWIVMVDMHHIITDGVSLKVLKKEFISLSREEKLPTLRIQYKDFSEWQNRRLAAGGMKSQEEFWLSKFKGNLPVLNMPLDFRRPGFRTSEGNTLRFEIGGLQVAAIRKLNKKTGTTLFMVLLAVYNVLLHKYSGQTDIVVGSPVSGRPQLDLENVLGVFVNMLPIRSQLTPVISFEEFLAELKITVLGAIENQDYPFEELVRLVGLQGDTARNPLFDVGLVLQDIEGADIVHGDDDSNGYENDAVNQVSRFDILLDAAEMENKIVIRLEYSTTLFKRASMQRFSKHYLEILQQVLENPAMKLKGIAISSDLLEAASIDREIEFEF